MPVPKYDDLLNPLLQAMHKLGGSASISEQEDTVASLLNLSEKDIAEIHRGNRTKLTMMGRADKGLLITTGAFTRDARLEAQRDGATPIDLIDGEELVEKLKQLGIGIEVRQRIVEDIIIKREYFQNL